MTLCVEALVSPEGGDFSTKLEDQVLMQKQVSKILLGFHLTKLLWENDLFNQLRDISVAVISES